MTHIMPLWGYGLFTAEENLEQEQEQVDEVEVQLQRTEDAHFHCQATITLNGGVIRHLFDFLRVIGGERGED